MMKTPLVLCALAVLAASCDRDQPASAPTGNPSGHTPTASAPSSRSADERIRPIPDHSLAVEEYTAAGVPAPDRPWSGKDYQSATRALVRISTRDYSQLPRLDSPRSGRLFSRMVASENLDALRTSTYPIEQRVQSLAELNKGFPPLIVLYQNNQRARQTFDAEVVQLTLYMFDYMTLSFSLVGEFMSSLAPDDERRDPNHAGLNKAREGWAANIGGALQMLDEKEIYRQSQRVVLADGLHARWPLLFHFLPDAQKDEIRTRLSRMAESESDQRVKRVLQHMADYQPPTR